MDSDMVNLTLEDESGIRYTICVSTEIAQKAQEDMSFATEILEAHKSSLTEDSTSTQENLCYQLNPEDTTVENSQTNENASETHFRWTHEVILLLIEEYRAYQDCLKSGRISQKRTWQNIATAMCQKGHEVTGPQCQSKFNGMKKTFKSIKDHNNKSGNNPRTWPYLQEMESLLGDRPYMAPLATCSSATGLVELNSNSDISDRTMQRVRPLKRGHNESHDSLIKILRENREIAERNKKKRHEENLKQRQELIDCIKKLINKNQ